ncbi:MAG: putative ABC exporter domain-containing protein, partial [Armatimonadota bacterium]
MLFFKLVKDYLRYGLWIAFFFFFIGSPLFGELGVSLMPLGLVSIAAIVALVLTVLNLAHTINIVFTFGYERLKAAAAAIKAAIALAVISAGGWGAYHYLRSGEGLASALSALEFPLLSAVFAPARWASELFLAPLSGVTPEQWGQLGLLWLLAIGSFVLLMSRNENVYEPSLGVSVRFARRRAAIRSKDFTDFRLTPLREKGVQRVRGIRIPPFGRGATAFLWKNLVLRYRLYRSQLALMAIVPLVIVVILARVVPAEYKRNVPFLLAYIVWALSLMAQAEFRLDLKYAD